MTQPVPIRRERTLRPYLPIALELATAGVPVLPLREGKVPFGNCRACGNNACGGRPHMKRAGECRCPGVCHGWAAATTNSDVLASPAWAAAWREAQAVAYHPGGAGLTVVDLDNAQAVAWAHQTLPATRTVPTTRGEHWIYLGAMRSANSVRPGVDIKSLMAYARWLGPGTGTMTQLPSAARTLVERKRPPPPVGRWSLPPLSAPCGMRPRPPAAGTPSGTYAPAWNGVLPWCDPAPNRAQGRRRSA